MIKNILKTLLFSTVSVIVGACIFIIFYVMQSTVASVMIYIFAIQIYTLLLLITKK